jgi:hypothetical protein
MILNPLIPTGQVAGLHSPCHTGLQGPGIILITVTRFTPVTRNPMLHTHTGNQLWAMIKRVTLHPGAYLVWVILIGNQSCSIQKRITFILESIHLHLLLPGQDLMGEVHLTLGCLNHKFHIQDMGAMADTTLYLHTMREGNPDLHFIHLRRMRGTVITAYLEDTCIVGGPQGAPWGLKQAWKVQA